jgi:hypothetical protein
MPYKVFISYSTKDLHIAQWVKTSLALGSVEVFLAESSIPASARLNAEIEAAIRACDLFVLLWSRNSKASDYVPQEIGIARGCQKTIMPIVLEPSLAVPGFISELKYLPAFQNPAQAQLWLQTFVAQNAALRQQQQTGVLVVLALLGLLALATSE